jgi:hypothetical protein
VTPERLRDRDVAHLALLGVDPDKALYVPVLLQLLQSLDEVIGRFFGDKTTTLTDTFVKKIPYARSSESQCDEELQDTSRDAVVVMLPGSGDDRIQTRGQAVITNRDAYSPPLVSMTCEQLSGKRYAAEGASAVYN